MEIIGIMIPNHIEVILTGLKRDLFSSSGLTSALAWQPMIPLDFSLQARSLEERELLNGLLPLLGRPLQPGPVQIFEKALYLSLSPFPEWENIQNHFSSSPQKPSAYPGILLAFLPSTDLDTDHIQTWVPELPQEFQPSSLVALEISSASSLGKTWWKDPLIKVVWKKKIPKGFRP